MVLGAQCNTSSNIPTDQRVCIAHKHALLLYSCTLGSLGRWGGEEHQTIKQLAGGNGCRVATFYKFQLDELLSQRHISEHAYAYYVIIACSDICILCN